MLKIYLDRAGVEHFALVTEEHADGTVDIAIVKPNYVNVPRSATPEPGTVYDPTFVAPVIESPPAPTGLTSVPPDANPEMPPETPPMNEPA